MDDLISVFCETCGRYLGIEYFCPDCNQERPYAKRLAESGQPLQTQTVPKLGNGGLQTWQDGWLIQTSSEGQIHAFRSEDGQHLWSYNVGQTVRTRLLKNGSRLYASSRKGNMLLALDINPTGVTKAWHYDLRGAGGGLTSHNGIVYLGDGEGFLHALRDVGAEAELIWPVLDVGQLVGAAPVTWHSHILVATHHSNGRLLTITADRGQILHEPVIVGDRVQHTPVVVNDRLLLVTQSGNLHLFQLPDGRRLGDFSQRLPAAVSAPLLVVERMVYLGLEDGRILACNMTTGQLGEVTKLNGQPVRDLVHWQKLLFIADDAGIVTAVEVDTKKIAWRWSAGAPLRGGLVVENGRLFVGQPEQLTILPWHLGQWSWAAAWCDRQGHLEAAGSCYALAGQKEKAAQRWQTAGKLRLSGQLWATFGNDKEAAENFREAAGQEEHLTPARASGLWIRAAYHFDLAKMKSEADDCRRKAGRIGRFAYLEIESFSLPLFEVGQPVQITLLLRNLGNDTANNIRLWLGGELEKDIEQSVTSLGRGEIHKVTFVGVIPSSTHITLTVALLYDGGARYRSFTQAEWSLKAVASPPGAIRIQGGEVGAVIVRVPEGAEQPSVRVGDGAMVGLIKYEVQPATALPGQTIFSDKLVDKSDKVKTETAKADDLPSQTYLLLGKYELLQPPIAEGGMGTVYKAYDRQAHRDVAVKMLTANRQQDPSYQKRFVQEARIISSLGHPAILPVYDYGEVNGRAYLVMRYVSGGTLQERIARSPLSPIKSARILNSVASGLDKAHKKGVIHRDIKGANILLDEDSNPYLVDFGIAHLMDATGTSTDIGTPPYMAPEQWQGKQLTQRTSVYQLGVLLFEMLTGRKPFQAHTREQYKHQHLHQEPPHLPEINSSLPGDYDKIIQQAMAKSPDKRYHTASALAKAFAQAVYHHG